MLKITYVLADLTNILDILLTGNHILATYYEATAGDLRKLKKI